MAKIQILRSPPPNFFHFLCWKIPFVSRKIVLVKFEWSLWFGTLMVTILDLPWCILKELNHWEPIGKPRKSFEQTY